MWGYVCNNLFYMYCVCIILRMHKRKMSLCQDYKIDTSITWCTLYNIAQNILHIHISENEFFSTTTVQQSQNVDSVGFRTFLVGWLACSSLIFCKFVVGAFRFVVGALHPLALPCLRAFLLHPENIITVSVIICFDARHIRFPLLRYEYLK
jgi:hypothetical protein